ncbi:restriction endonuclease [Cytobacillus pseudoceanisediminis]|uniref:Restriction endonuclease n=1 Tax=Cytobacillus pseudoceanisediminis TaxID=3051614 RepID=A0ABZ2ZP64_9BACI
MDSNIILIPKIKLSKSVGWSEANGRRWIKQFEEYIPKEEKGNKTLYNQESIRIVKIIKKLSDIGLTSNEIKNLFDNKGVPKNEIELTSLLNTYNSETIDNSFKPQTAISIPLHKEIMIPHLKVMSNGAAITSSEITEALVRFFNLEEEQRVMTYKNSKDSIFMSRIRSARYSLKKEGYIEEINRHTYQITDEGIKLLNENYTEIEEEIEELDKLIDPLNVINENIKQLKEELGENILKQLKKVHWVKFEEIVVDLLTKMGYGDGEVTQRTNDNGLDGVIKEDKLGLDNIYVQAKRWDSNSIGRDVVQSFSGALDPKGARKGIFITTSYFTAGAIEYAQKLESKKIILIDGKQLAKYMIEYNVGTDIKMTFVIKDIDYDYFKE